METCAGCGATAGAHPWVGVGQSTTVPICSACQAEPTHRTRPLKVTFFSRMTAGAAVALAGSTRVSGQTLVSGAKPWGALDPNSQHQLWSHWLFTVREFGQGIASIRTVAVNARRWLRQGFGSVGEARVERKLFSTTLPDGVVLHQSGYVIEGRVEACPRTTPVMCRPIERDFQRFVVQGWGSLAVGAYRQGAGGGPARREAPYAGGGRDVRRGFARPEGGLT